MIRSPCNNQCLHLIIETVEMVIDHILKEMTNATTVDSMVTGNLNADLAAVEAAEATEEEEISIDVTLEEEITVDLMIEEIIIETIDSVEETDLDPTLQETIEVHKDKATMTSEEDQERDPDLAAEMDLHTVENGIVMTTDILSEEA